MASVRLNFVPPDVPDLEKLLIYESDAEGGAYNLIETVIEIGEYDNYLSQYTTDQATSLFSWFKIQWEDDKGAQTPLSQAIQGGTTTTVGEIIQRVMNRNPSADENVVANVAEAVIEEVMNTDPYTVDWNSLTYRQREGLTLLTLAYATVAETATGGTTRYTAGLVSEEVKSDTADVDQLFKLAWKWLGISHTRIAQMDEIIVAGGFTRIEKDQSRLLLSEFA